MRRNSKRTRAQESSRSLRRSSYCSSSVQSAHFILALERGERSSATDLRRYLQAILGSRSASCVEKPRGPFVPSAAWTLRNTHATHDRRTYWGCHAKKLAGDCSCVECRHFERGRDRASVPNGSPEPCATRGGAARHEQRASADRGHECQ